MQKSGCGIPGLIILLLIISITSFGQVLDISGYRIPFHVNGIELYRISSGPVFRDKQQVFLARINGKYLSGFSLEVAFSDSLLKPTSTFAKETDAVVALNGSFFDVEKGGSVAYLESEGKVKAWNRSSDMKWGKSDSLLNGAIVLGHSGELVIEKAKKDSVYELSGLEKSVLVSGPLLLLDGKKVTLENSPFVHKKHPRSCLCETKDKSILLVAIDGRSENAAGMNLEEAAEFLLALGCMDAINLDGGGSTTIWVRDGTSTGILNHPSDKEGERPVSNCIVIKQQ